ncbi:hypothetical protein FOL46_008470, partial [Perkinsus olseni]
ANPQATLQMMADHLWREKRIDVCAQTVKNHLDSRAYTVKRPHIEGEAVNNLINRQKRREFVQAVSAIPCERLVYFDETNVNLFVKRGVARSIKGSRAVLKEGSSKGPNIHCFCCITQTGLGYHKIQRGSITKGVCAEIVGEMLDSMQEAGHDLTTLVFVGDNAPAHSGLEAVFNGRGM